MRYIEFEYNLRKTLCSHIIDNIECFVIERHLMIIYVFLLLGSSSYDCLT